MSSALTVRRRYLVSQSVLGIVGCVALAGCGGGGSSEGSASHHIRTHGGTLSAVTLEHAIAGSARSQRHAAATVDCPPGIRLKTKLRFYCVAEVGNRNTPFLVTERDTKGNVTYRGMPAGQVPLLDATSIATAIKRSIAGARQVRAAVSCPTGIPRQSGLRFVCLATTRTAGTTQFLVSETDSSGHVRYRAR
jgi:hypothetical protein